jgi:cysteine desulfurase/selenocysteine lyase
MSAIRKTGAGAPAPEATGPRPARVSFDVRRIRADFPILERKVHGKPLVYLDSAATSQKPRSVIEAIRRYYENTHANIHRGVYRLSEEATAEYEGARAKAQRLLNARDRREIVFVRGATEALNLVAGTFGRTHVRAGDEVIVSEMEHHSNIVPWQLLCEQAGARLRVIPMNDSGELVLEAFERLLGPRTRILALAHVSNALGTINPIRPMIERARRHDVAVVIDGAQAIGHVPVDVRALDCDFYVFSGHKAYGPTGCGVLYGKLGHLEAMPPYQSGGDMIRSVTFEKTTFADAPQKFEAGTPNIAGAVGLAAAIDYIAGIGYPAIRSHDGDLLEYATDRLSRVPGLRIIGTAKEKVGVISFVLDGIHPHDVGTVLDRQGIAVRTGHHCAQPVMAHFKVPATARASFAVYTTRDDIDALIGGLHRVIEVFR